MSVEQYQHGPRPKPSKRDAILDAMLDIVVESGFHDAPMSLTAQSSGASARRHLLLFFGQRDHTRPLRANPCFRG
jgi:hypothetical protein